MFLETFFCSVGNFSAFTSLAGKFHFFRIKAICFDKFFAIMTEKNDSSSVRIEGYFLFSIRRDIHEVALDTIESSIFSFWSWGWGLNWFRHRGNCKQDLQKYNNCKVNYAIKPCQKGVFCILSRLF